MKIAGVNSLGFFIELAEYFIFYFLVFKLLCGCREAKQQQITPRYILSDWGIPHDKNKFIHNSKT